MSGDKIELTGEVILAIKDNFTVRINDKHQVLAKLSGKIRTAAIKIVPGDTVIVEVSPYDTNKGRIIYRMKSDQ